MKSISTVYIQEALNQTSVNKERLPVLRNKHEALLAQLGRESNAVLEKEI